MAFSLNILKLIWGSYKSRPYSQTGGHVQTVTPVKTILAVLDKVMKSWNPCQVLVAVCLIRMKCLYIILSHLPRKGLGIFPMGKA